jgi:hypothetical protein
LNTTLIIFAIFAIFAVTILWIAYHIVMWHDDTKRLSKLTTELSDLSDANRSIKKDQITNICQSFWPLLRNIVIPSDNSGKDIIRPVLYRDGRVMVNKMPDILFPPGRWGYIAPTLMIIIGICGIFYGINIGLMHTKLTIKIAEGYTGEATKESIGAATKELINNAKMLFDGMNTAFYTSLWGIVGATLALILVVLLHIFFKEYKKKCQNMLYEVFVIASPATHFIEVKDQLSTLHQMLEKQFTLLQQMLKDADFSKLRTNTEEQLQKLNKNTEEICSYLVGTFSETDLPENIQVAISEIMSQTGDMLKLKLNRSQDSIDN